MSQGAAVRASGLLNVGGGHEIYWEESGRSDGIPAIYLHGGPGGTLGTGNYRTRFDQSRFRIVGLDQRGSSPVNGLPVVRTLRPGPRKISLRSSTSIPNRPL